MRVESEERIPMAIQGFSFGNNISNRNVPTTTGLVNCKPSKMACEFC
jgi:hypothetical protein